MTARTQPILSVIKNNKFLIIQCLDVGLKLPNLGAISITTTQINTQKLLVDTVLNVNIKSQIW